TRANRCSCQKPHPISCSGLVLPTAIVELDCGRITDKSDCPYITRTTMTKPQDNENSGIFAVILNQPYLLLVLAPLFWGGNLVVAKLVVGEIDPFLLLAARCVLATLFILPF